MTSTPGAEQQASLEPGASGRIWKVQRRWGGDTKRATFPEQLSGATATSGQSQTEAHDSLTGGPGVLGWDE